MIDLVVHLWPYLLMRHKSLSCLNYRTPNWHKPCGVILSRAGSLTYFVFTSPKLHVVWDTEGCCWGIHSYCWQGNASCWHEASVLRYMDISIGLLECPYDVVAGFSQRAWSKKKQGRNTMPSLTWSQKFSSAVFIIPIPHDSEWEGTAQGVTTRKLDSSEAVLDQGTPAPFHPPDPSSSQGRYLTVLFSPPCKESLSWRCYLATSCSLRSVGWRHFLTRDHPGAYQLEEATYALKMSG